MAGKMLACAEKPGFSLVRRMALIVYGMERLAEDCDDFCRCLDQLYISCTMDELDGLIAFLEDCKSEMGEDEEYAHFHLWFWEGWRFPKNCDVVLYFNDHLLNPAAFDFKDVLRDGN